MSPAFAARICRARGKSLPVRCLVVCMTGCVRNQRPYKKRMLRVFLWGGRRLDTGSWFEEIHVHGTHLADSVIVSRLLLSGLVITNFVGERERISCALKWWAGKSQTKQQQLDLCSTSSRRWFGCGVALPGLSPAYGPFPPAQSEVYILRICSVMWGCRLG